MTDRHVILNAGDLHFPTGIRTTDAGFGRAVRVLRTALRPDYLASNPPAVLADVAWVSRDIAAYLSLDDPRGESAGVREAIADTAAAHTARLRSFLRPAGQDPIAATIAGAQWLIPAAGGRFAPPTITDLLNALWPALVTRDSDLIAFLLGAPGVTGYPLAATSRTERPMEQCLYLWFDAWQRFQAGDPATETVIVDGIEAAVDAQAAAADDYHLLIAYSALCALDAVVRADAAEFATALVEGLEFHRRFWDTERRWTEPEGFIAWPLLAVSCVAVDRGMPLPVPTDYLPASLLHPGS
ncbi:immunity 49 family protein [Nocardia sp. NBC_00511]|uniref:immunity 49 family protein n=1 Tax=Nocardia sp. NBC_00511 TaxID=2903591 RepID=UPI0030E5A925